MNPHDPRFPPRPVDPALGYIVPVGRFSTAAMLAGYLAILLLLFGGLFAVMLVLIAFHLETRADRVLLRVLSGAVLVLGVGPVASCAALGRRAIAQDRALQGNGRAIFAYVVCALVALPTVLALVKSLF